MRLSARKEQVRLLELESERTAKFIESIVGSGHTIRGWAITLTLGLLGVAFDRGLWQVGVLAAVVTLMFGLLDAYHSWIYSQALRRAHSVDRVLGLYYAALARGSDDPDAVTECEVELDAHKFGLLSNLLGDFGFSSIRDVRPRFVLVVLYGTLLVLAVIGTVLLVGGTQPPQDGRWLIFI